MDMKVRIRAYLGLDSVPSLTMFQAMEKKQAERHAQILGAIQALDVKLQENHVTSRPVNVPLVLDWEQVQILQMQEFEKKDGN